MKKRHPQSSEQTVERLKSMLSAYRSGNYTAPNRINGTPKRNFEDLPENTVYALR